MYQRNGFALKKHAQSRESVLFCDIMSEKEVLIDTRMGTNTGMQHIHAKKKGISVILGAKYSLGEVPDEFIHYELPQGEYIVCSFEADNFEALVMDALYKAQQYIYNIWMPNHKLQTEEFCAERYASHSSETTNIEIWLKLTT